MATQKSQAMGRIAVTPSVIVLFLWMTVPLGLTIYCSTMRHNLLYPERSGFVGITNYTYFVTNPAFITAIVNTLVLVGSVLVITVVLGTLLALLLDKPIFGQGIMRLMVIEPFFIMPIVSALVWKNLLMNPVSGFFA